jgi:hypothetical protein
VTALSCFLTTVSKGTVEDSVRLESDHKLYLFDPKGESSNAGFTA